MDRSIIVYSLGLRSQMKRFTFEIPSVQNALRGCTIIEYIWLTDIPMTSYVISIYKESKYHFFYLACKTTVACAKIEKGVIGGEIFASSI